MFAVEDTYQVLCVEGEIESKECVRRIMRGGCSSSPRNKLRRERKVLEEVREERAKFGSFVYFGLLLRKHELRKENFMLGQLKGGY